MFPDSLYPKADNDIIPQAMNYQAVYPEVFYRLQPYVVMVVDQMDGVFGTQMPSQEMVERISDGIHDDMMKIYPDMGNYVTDRASEEQKAGDPPFDWDYRRRFRRRGLFRDIIDILLLNEFLRRRRRYY